MTLTIKYKDQVFRTVAQAAIYFGKTRQGVSYHLRRYGNLDRIGEVDTSKHKPIIIRGVFYHSVADAARKLGVARATIRQARDKGYLDVVGTQSKGRGQRNSVVIRGRLYATQTLAAKSLNVSVGAISNALNRGSLERVGLGLHLRTRKQPIPITIGGVTYPSHKAACEALSISPYSLRRLKERERGSVARNTLAV